MHLLVLNLRVDADDTALGFTTAWINALADRCDHVSVITMHAGTLAVRDNVSVHSLGRERGTTRTQRVMRFYRHALRIMRRRRVDACFAHMTPRFAAMFAPLALAWRIPTLLWYAHGAVPWDLRLAHLLVDRCVTSTPQGFRLPSDKLFVVGQGIDADVFRPPPDTGNGYHRRAVAIGRLSQVKRNDEMLDALAIVRGEHGLDVELELVGEPLTPRDEAYVAGLRERAVRLALGDGLTFAGPVPFHAVPERYRRAGIFVNLAEQQSLDKAIVEAMASGCVPVCRNASWVPIAEREGLGALVPAPGAEGLAEALRRAATMESQERREATARLREAAIRDHGLNRLTDRLMDHLRELAAMG